MSKQLARFRSLSRSQGLLRSVAIAPLWTIHRRFVVSYRLIDDVLDEPAEEVNWERLGGDRLQELLTANPVLELEELKRREASEMICFVFRVEDKIAHYRWYAYTPQWLPFLQLRWVPEHGDYTMLDAFTVPEFRGRGIAASLRKQGIVRAQALGLRRFVSFVAWWNRLSLRSLERGGLSHLGSVTLWRLGFWSLHSASGDVHVRDGELRIADRTAPKTLSS